MDDVLHMWKGDIDFKYVFLDFANDVEKQRNVHEK